MALSRPEIHAIVKERFGDGVVEDHPEARDPYIVVKPEILEELAFFCRDEPRLRFDLLSSITGVDYPDRNVIEVIYCLDSTPNKHWLIAKVLRSEEHTSELQS